MHDFFVKRAVDFVLDLLLHSLRAPATNARHFYSCFQACILPPNFLTGSLRTGKLHRWPPDLQLSKWAGSVTAPIIRRSSPRRLGLSLLAV